jgi:hypothetical protein
MSACKNCNTGEKATHEVIMNQGLVAMCDKCYND